MQRALESALAELVLGPEIAEDDPTAIEAWLARHELTGDDARALSRDFARLGVYRRLVRGNLQEALRATIPRTVSRLAARFDLDFDDFLRASPPTTRYLRDVTPSFLAFACPRWAADVSVPPFLADLARHEAVQVEVASLLARPKTHVPAELALERPVEFIDALRLMHYAWAVHRLSDDQHARDLPEAGSISLLVYRSPEHEVRYLELGPFAAALMDALTGERLSLHAALVRAAARVEQPLDDALLARSARLLADLAERGVLLGKSAEEAAPAPI